MMIPDVNVLIYAHRSDTENHGSAARWLSEALEKGEPLGLSQQALLGFYRIVTNRIAFKIPAEPSEARSAVEALFQHQNVTVIEPDQQFWRTALTMFEQLKVVGPATSDAFFAALAIRHGAQLVTFDRGFKRYPGLDLLLLS